MDKRTVWALVASLILIGTGIAVAVYFGVSMGGKKDPYAYMAGSDYFDTMGDPLTFFGVSDALDIVWYHGANSKAQTKDALMGYFMMVEGDVMLRYQGLPNQTNIPIMAIPPAVDSDNTFYEWLQTMLTRQDKGLKLDFKSADAIEPVLRILSSRRYLDRPVWLNADVAIGPGGANAKQKPIDGKRFLSQVQKTFPRVTLSLGWVTECCEGKYTRAMMEEMWQLCKDSVQPVTISARAGLLTKSWSEFKWLLSKSSKMTITVWTPKGQESWENVSTYEMLHIWNDFDNRRIYFDLPGKRFEMFQKLTVTAASLLNYFPLKSRDALEITWAHAANNKAEVSEALKSDVMMLEADVIVRGRGTENQTTVPVMAHPPQTDSDNTFYMWLQAVLLTNKGIKLDFKDLAAVKPALEYLKQQLHLIRQPIWLNADILRGPQGGTPVDAKMFLNHCKDYFPMATLSIGWTTGWTNSDSDGVYTKTMIDEMLEAIKTIEQPVTFPVRAAMVKKSWPLLKDLVEKSLAYTMTIWSSKTDNVDPDDMVYVRNNIGQEKVYFDLPEPLNSAFMKKIGYKYN